MDFEFGATMDGLQGMETLFEGAHVCGVPGAEIESGSSHFGDDVDAGAALDDVGIDGDTAAMIVPLFDAGDLRGEFMNGVDTFFRGETRMRGAGRGRLFRLRRRLCGRF